MSSLMGVGRLAVLYITLLDLGLAYAQDCTDCSPMPAGPMPGQNSTNSGNAAASQSGGNRAAICSSRTCQGGVVSVNSSELSVLEPGFNRSLMAAWRDTKITTANGISSTVGSEYNLTNANFIVLNDYFAKLVGPDAYAEVLAERNDEFAHEGPVFLPDSNEVFFTSNVMEGPGQQKRVELYAVELDSGDVRNISTSEPVPLANGAVAYQDGVALLAQGNDSDPGGVLLLDPYSGDWQWLINNWFGLAFNSPNDIVATEDGALWFTDPSYAYNQELKGPPQLGEFVWRFVPGRAPARVVADGFERPNGLALSKDEKTLYVSDTGLNSGRKNEAPDPTQPHTIYAFDILGRSGGSFLADRRVFAVCDTGIPDGVKLDNDGNVYSGCGDGLNIWAPSGDLIGKIHVDGGISNFCFAGNDLILLAETRILKIRLNCTGGCT